MEIFVGMDWERKGGPELVEAFKKVLTVHPDARLIIVGCSPQITVPNCDVVGRIPSREVHTYYNASAVFCLPTILEPFGLVFIEAMSHRLPVVGTNIGAIPDFVVEGHNGHLVSPRDSSSLADALIDLVGNPEKCRRFGEAGRRIAAERYNWKAVSALLREHILAALGECPGI